MTLEDAAAAIGLSHAQLQRIETRQQEYHQAHLERLAKTYRVSVCALLERDPDLEDRWEEIDRYRVFVLSRGHSSPSANPGSISHAVEEFE